MSINKRGWIIPTNDFKTSELVAYLSSIIVHYSRKCKTIWTRMGGSRKLRSHAKFRLYRSKIRSLILFFKVLFQNWIIEIAFTTTQSSYVALASFHLDRKKNIVFHWSTTRRDARISSSVSSLINFVSHKLVMIVERDGKCSECLTTQTVPENHT